jgi:hypothetical protein
MLPGSLDRCNYPNIADESRPYERVVIWVQTLWARISPWMVRLITGLVLLVASLCLLDALCTTQLESSLYRREVPEYVVVVERTHQVSKGLTGVSPVL